MNQEAMNEILMQIESKRLSPEQGLKMLEHLKGKEVLDSKTGGGKSGFLFFKEEWEETPLSYQEPDLINGPIIVFEEGNAISDSFKHMSNSKRYGGENESLKVIRIIPGKSFEEKNDGCFVIRPQEYTDYLFVIDLLMQRGIHFDKVVHAWCECKAHFAPDLVGEQLASSYFSVYHFCKALIEKKYKHPLELRFAYKSIKGHHPIFSSMSSFLKTVHQEYPSIRTSCIEIDEVEQARFAEILVAELSSSSWEEEVKYKKEVRLSKRQKIRSSRTISSSFSRKELLKPKGVYIITGGLGGVGYKFACHFAEKANARLVLCGRSESSRITEEKLERLASIGAEVTYLQVDITNPEDVTRLIFETKQKYGHIDGIIHGAGVIRDAYIIRKTVQNMEEVINPKVYGTILLDEATKTEQLDWFVVLSSLSEVWGNPGQCDYSFANRFMKQYCSYRNRSSNQKEPLNRFVSIDWPLWAEGGMSVDDALPENVPIKGMPTNEGIEAWEQILKSNEEHVSILYGDENEIEKYFEQLSARKQVKPKEVASTIPPLEGTQLLETIKKYITFNLGDLLKLSPEKIDVYTPFQDYGVDSMAIKAFNKILEDELGNVSKTLLYEYQTVEELADFLYEYHAPQFAKILKQTQIPEDNRGANNKKNHTTSKKQMQANDKPIVAIVGLAGQYPNASNTEEFWDLLKSSQSCFQEIPNDRWNYEEYLDKGIYCKRGAFVNGVENFDPLLFKMNPLESKLINPEERKFLECVWTAMEDGGYNKDYWSGKRVGVFVGVTSMTYPLAGIDHWVSPTPTPINSTYFSLPNRISYFFNLNGPSLALDTACSSSLTAIHMACQSIWTGESEAAIAGGVNFYLHPSKYLSMCQSKMLSSKDHIELFDRDGDGFIPGEGIGAVLLKPLNQALEDGDYIYGTVRGSGSSHKGYSSGFFLPDPQSQTSLIESVLESSDTDPATIGYAELQALGSEMTDIIEWTGIRRAYEAHTSKKQYCAVGSLKPIIGHLEAASGISQLTKVLLQLKHKKILPNKVAKEINSGISVENSPFYIPESEMDWPSMEVKGIDETLKLPRRAAISSFGAGGSEAHLIIEEWMENESPIKFENKELEEYAIPVSARTQQQLTSYVEILLDHLNRHRYGDEWLADIAFTLQNGRQSMQKRAVFICKQVEQLKQQMQDYIDSSNYEPEVGLLKERINNNSQVVIEDREQTKLKVVADRWLRGEISEWIMDHKMNKRRRIPLPTYPFEKRRCWMYSTDKQVEQIQDAQEDREKKTASLSTGNSDNVVASYYDASIQHYAEGSTREGYLTFAPFNKKVEGFSWIRVFSQPDQFADHAVYALEKQKEMRRVLYRHIDFGNVFNLLDIGCGFSTDLIEFARLYPHLTCDGYTISGNQAEFGRVQVQQNGLAEQIQIYCKDSSKDEYPSHYDLIIGLEVTVHIADKQGVFGNMSRHLSPKGKIVLADCIANTMHEVNLPEVGQYTVTQSQYSKILADHRLQIVDCVDASKGVSNFLHDSNFEENLAFLNTEYPDTKGMENEHKAWNNFGKALGLELFRYVLLTIEKAEDSLTWEELKKLNEQALTNSINYENAAEKWARRTEKAIQVLNDGEKDQSRLSLVSKYDEGEESIRQLEDKLTEWFGETLEMGYEEINRQIPFADYGIDSLLGLKILDVINRNLQIKLEVHTLFDHSNIHDLALYLSKTYSEAVSGIVLKDRRLDLEKSNKSESDAPFKEVTNDSKPLKQITPALPLRNLQQTKAIPSEVAIVGISGKFPGAEDVNEFWENLIQGIDSITEIPEERWNKEELYDPDPLNPNKSQGKWGGFLKDVDKFDPAFFNISPVEAEMMDPQQRLFLQESYKALEDAGYSLKMLNRIKCGVMAGVFGNEYSSILENSESEYKAQLMLGNTNSILASRISYFLNLKGPAISIDTACSSSLVAIHVACKSLINRETDLMLAGGVTLYLTEKPYISMSKAGMLSHDGKCKTFSNEADGIVPAEAVAIVVLKRLDDALKDGDHIYGIIKGSEINQDGRTNGITAPSSQSQTELEEEVYRKYDINPSSISYVEAHGTGTKLGDPIELTALSQAFSSYTGQKQFCAIGSVKSNLGHTSAASGAVGLIKVLLCLKHAKLPATLHAHEENEHMNFKDSPFYLNHALSDWPRTQKPRRAAINSFGFSGTNCHMVVEEAPESVIDQHRNYGESKQVYILPISAKTKEQLQVYARKVLEFLLSDSFRKEIDESQEGYVKELESICYTFQTGRAVLEQKLAIAASSLEGLCEKLSKFLQGETNTQGIYAGSRQASNPYELLIEGAEGREFINSLILGKKQGKIAQLWAMGIEIDWQLLYGEHRPQKMPLPSYPFAKQRYWPVLKKAEKVSSSMLALSINHTHSTVNDGDSSEKNITYIPRWKLFPAKSVNKESKIKKNRVLIFTTNAASSFVESLKNEHQNDELGICEVSADARFSSSCDFRLNIQDEECLSECLAHYTSLDLIYFLADFDASELELWTSVSSGLELNTIFFFRLVKLLAEQKYAATNIKVITFGQYKIEKDDEVYFVSGGLHSLAETLAKEFTQFRFSRIDLHRNLLEESKNIQEIAGNIKRMVAEPSHENKLVAFREDQRYERVLSPIEIPLPSSTPFKMNGTYIIIGGLGTVGYALAEYLAKSVGASLTLVGRRPEDENISTKISKLKSYGAKVVYVQGDVKKLKDMQHVVAMTKLQFGSINGIVQSALDISPLKASEITTEFLRRSMETQVHGSVAIFEAVQKEKLDFLLLFSSAQSFVGTAGWAHYAASCEYKDIYANYLSDKSKFPVFVVNWGFWSNRNGEFNEELNRYINLQGAYAIREDEAMNTVEALLSGDIRQLVTIKAQDYVLELMNVEREAVVSHSVPSKINLVESRVIREEDLKEKVIEQVTEEVCKVLHIHPENINEELTFMELGVDSILALTIVRNLNEVFSCELTPKDLFDHATIIRMADHVINETHQRFSTLEQDKDLKSTYSEMKDSAPITVKEKNEDDEESLKNIFYQLEMQKLDVKTADFLLKKGEEL